MSRTIKIYRPLIKFGLNVINLELDDILQRIFINERENNLRLINAYPTILTNYGNRFNAVDYIGGTFWKYRQNYKPYIGELDRDRIIPIDEIVVETTTFIYDRMTNCIALESNREGTTDKDFIKYIESFLPENYKIELSKVYDQITLDDVLNSTKIRSLEIKLKLNSDEENILRDNYNEIRNPILDFFTGVVNASQETGTNLNANFAYWKFDLGREKGTFNLESFRIVAEALDLNSDKIEAVKVKFAENRNGLKEYDLKNIGKQYSFKILENSELANPGPEYILDTLQQVFDQNHRMNLIVNNNIEREEHNFNFLNLNLTPRYNEIVRRNE